MQLGVLVVIESVSLSQRTAVQTALSAIVHSAGVPLCETVKLYQREATRTHCVVENKTSRGMNEMK